jgi:hypothetical protein
MSATLPLPLELTRSAELERDPDTNLKEMYQVRTTRYNASTQVRENQEGVPLILNQDVLTISVVASSVITGSHADSDNANDD